MKKVMLVVGMVALAAGKSLADPLVSRVIISTTVQAAPPLDYPGCDEKFVRNGFAGWSFEKHKDAARSMDLRVLDSKSPFGFIMDAEGNELECFFVEGNSLVSFGIWRKNAKGYI